MNKLYSYTVQGSGGDGGSFLIEGTLESPFGGELFDAVMARSFDALTHGKAVYGSPGVGCRGPYEIDRIIIAQVRQ